MPHRGILATFGSRPIDEWRGRKAKRDSSPRRPTFSSRETFRDTKAAQERKGKKKPACSVRKDRGGLEQSGLAAGEFAAEIFVGARGGDAAARGAVNHADLHEIGLIHF